MSSSKKKEWNLLCVTHKGKVTMLRDLDLHTARETYKRLMPRDHPLNYIDPECAKCRNESHQHGNSFMSMGRSYGPHDDWLDKVEIVGPSGEQLDPWHGMKPHDRYIYHCRCPKPPPPWDSRRADFWNNPKLWEGIDPTKQFCWQESPDEHLHSDGPCDGGAKRRQRSASDLRRDKRSEGVSPQRRDRKTSRVASSRQVTLSRLSQSERTGA